MSIGAYSFFKERNSVIFYLPIGKNSYQQIFPYQINAREEKFSYRISLKDYFTAYGIKVNFYNRTIKSADYTDKLLHYYLTSHFPNSLMRRLRLLRNNKKISINTEIRTFLSEIDFSTAENDYLSKSEIQYLTGGWFEEFCYNLIKEKLNLDSSQIGFNLHISHNNAQNELDVAFIRDNALNVIECKTVLINKDRNLINDTLYKITALRKDFGIFAKSYLFTLDSNLRDKNGVFMEHIANRANVLNIDIIDRIKLKKIISANRFQ